MSIRSAARVIEAETGVTLKQMRQQGKQPEHITHARNLLIYALYTVLEWSWKDVAKALSRNVTSCQRAFYRVEQQREQPIYNRLIVGIMAKVRNQHRLETIKRLGSRESSKRIS